MHVISSFLFLIIEWWILILKIVIGVFALRTYVTNTQMFKRRKNNVVS